MKIAVIDCGSNTIKLAIYKIEQDNTFKILHTKKTYLGIIQYIQNNVLNNQGFEKLLETLSSMLAFSKKNGCEHVYAFATASLRNIGNLGTILCAIKEQLDLEIEIVSGNKEIIYDFMGLKLDVQAQQGFACDLGGGSAQIFAFQGSDIVQGISLPIGCLKMYGKFVSGILPKKGEMNAIYAEVKRQIKPYYFIRTNNCSTLYLMGGIGKAIARIHKNLSQNDLKIDQYKIKATEIPILMNTILNFNGEGATLLNKLLPERSHLVIPGMIVLDTIIQLANVDEIIILKYGVREGFLKSNVMDLRRRK